MLWWIGIRSDILLWVILELFAPRGWIPICCCSPESPSSSSKSPPTVRQSPIIYADTVGAVLRPSLRIKWQNRLDLIISFGNNAPV
jgi:hypothetical protein